MNEHRCFTKFFPMVLAVLLSAVARAENHVLLLSQGALDVPHSAAQNEPAERSALTIEYWIRFESQNGQGAGRPVAKRGCSSPGYTLGIESGTRRMVAELGGVGVATGPSVPQGSWHHCATVWDGPAGKIRFYLDGELSGEGNVPPHATLQRSEYSLR